MSSGKEPVWLDVENVAYSIHRKIFKPSSLKVSYDCFGHEVAEWVCFDHEGFAKREASSWARHAGDAALWETLFCPDELNTEDALGIKWNKPLRICVKKEGKYNRIIARDYIGLAELATME